MRTHSAPTARELMNTSVKYVTPDLALGELVDFFLKERINCAPVVEDNDDDRTLLGFVSQGDALATLASQIFSGSPRMPIEVEQIMKRHPVAVRPDTDVFAVASIFNSHGYRHVPVVDSNNRLMGLISRREILIALTGFFAKQQREFDQKHFPPDSRKIINHRFLISGR